MNNKTYTSDISAGKLTKEWAEKLPLTASDPVANDWLNGRRTPFADQTLKGGIVGITLATTPAQIFESLKSAYVRQTLSDVMGVTIKVSAVLVWPVFIIIPPHWF